MGEHIFNEDNNQIIYINDGTADAPIWRAIGRTNGKQVKIDNQVKLKRGS